MNRLKVLRQEKKLTQEELGKLFEVSKMTVLRWESGENQIKPDKAQRLADYFKVSVGYLLGFTDNPNIYKDEQVESLGENISAFSYQRYNEGKINKFIAFLDDLDIILSDEQIEYVFYLIESMDLNRILPNLKEASGVDFMDGVDVRLGEEKVDAFYDYLSKAGYTKLVPGLKK
ncbi:MAG: helix-turn-helix transcriptional regulator [Streptococcus parauberis]